ncbi:MAG: LapA family protein [Solirubrobacteraceae bacterium]
MVYQARSTSVHSPAPGVTPDTITGPVSNGSSVAGDRDVVPAPHSAATDRETRRERSRRKARRSRLHGYAILTVALVAFLIALAASNTSHVKVNWVFGSSHVSLVWLVLFAAILGWLLGLVATAAFHWRTRAPRRGGRTS